MEKSYVSMEQRQCIVCGVVYDTGSILMDKRLRASMEKNTVTGTGFCPEHQKLKDEGYIALIEADPATDKRTGNIAHIRASVWPDLFRGEHSQPPGGMVAYVTPDTMDALKKIAGAATDDQDQT
jgi:hypothetical protein